jgi:hypothetical protein
MIKHIISLFKPDKIKKTLILFATSALLITVSLIVGTGDNIPMITMLLAGIVFLFFTVLHPWEKAVSFAVLTVVCFVILALDFMWPFINEDVAMTAGFGCLAGIMTGIIGIFTRVKSWKRLPYSGALLSVIALGIIITTVVPSLKGIITLTSEWLLIGIQLLITISLFGIGIINKSDNRINKIMLVVLAVILILLSIWGFYVSKWPVDEIRKNFDTLMIRIFSGIEIIIALLSLYACKRSYNKK